MATVPAGHTAEAPPSESFEERFRRLEAVWREETYVLSDAGKIIGHPAFQEIISMGKAVVPLMMKDLEKRSGLWVWALPRIMGENPVSLADGGNIPKMTEAWLRWGREHGYR